MVSYKPLVGLSPNL